MCMAMNNAGLTRFADYIGQSLRSQLGSAESLMAASMTGFGQCSNHDRVSLHGPRHESRVRSLPFRLVESETVMNEKVVGLC